MYPKTFHEFYSAHPEFVRMLIHKNKWAKFEHVDDLEQELLSEMLRKRVVEKFDASIYSEPNIRLFMSYLITCVTRLFYTSQTFDKAPTRTLNNIAVSLSDPLQADGESATISDTIDDEGRASGQMEAIVELGQLASYINQNYPKMSDVMKAVLTHGTISAKDLSDNANIPAYRLSRFLSLVRKFNNYGTHK
jgi:hypothetical protein